MKHAVICFTRVPKPGVTKTRLLPILKPEQCAKLHWCFLKDLAEIYKQMNVPLFVAYTPDPDWEQLKSVFPDAGFFVQKGADLGERMYHAVCTVLELGYESVVLTGADLPMLKAEHLLSGFDALKTADIAIGPTSDGGYYLIGMKQPHKAVFHVERYGGSSVFENTVAAAEAAGLTIIATLSCDDVDTPEDLKQLTAEVNPGSHTGSYLNVLKEEGIQL